MSRLIQKTDYFRNALEKLKESVNIDMTNSVIKTIVFIMFFFNLTLQAKEKISTRNEKPKNWNISINLQYYGYDSLGPLAVFNYKYFQCFTSYSHTVFGGYSTFETGWGGQYDLIKSEKMDSIFFANLFFTTIDGKMDKLTHDGLSDVTILYIGHSIGYEFSAGKSTVKFNTGIALDFKICVYSKTEDDRKGVRINDLGFYSLPKLKLYVGIKF